MDSSDVIKTTLLWKKELETLAILDPTFWENKPILKKKKRKKEKAV